MNCLIIYKSIHQNNTKKIAQKIAETLEADLKDVSEINNETNFDNYDLIGLGSGIYGFKHHQLILNLVKNKNDWQNKNVFIFSTSGEGNNRQHEKLKELLKNKKANILGEFACPGFINWGPWKLWGGSNKGRPNNDDLIKAEKFAQGLKNS